MKFKFANIYLPDSNTNEPESHGFISYNVKQHNNNVIGDVINNSAAIYFDYAAPVITNTTINTIISPQAINNMLGDDNYVKIYPTPANDYLQIAFEKSVDQKTEIGLINAIGAIVIKDVMNEVEKSKRINVSMLANGIYTLKLQNDLGSVIQKISIQK